MSHVSKGDLHAFIDGDLTGDREPEKQEIEEHLKSCEECAQLLLEERDLVHLVSHRLEIPEHILDSLPTAEGLKTIPQGSRRRRTATFLSRWWILQPVWKVASVASVALLGVGGWVIKNAAVSSAVMFLGGEVAQNLRTPGLDELLQLDSAVAALYLRTLDPNFSESLLTFWEDSLRAPLLLRGEPGELRISEDARAIAKGMPATDGDLPVPEIQTGETILGNLEIGDETLEDGSFADLWMYGARAGSTVIIDLLSNDFDAYLFIGDEEAVILAEDNDSGGGTDSRIFFTPTESKSYRIVVNSYGENEVGQYGLSVTLEDRDTAEQGPFEFEQD